MATFTVDKAHSDVEFSVRHMGISTVRGRFGEFSGSLELDGNKLTGAKADIETASIHTKEEKRDAHLRSADFFDAEKNPKITFVSKSVQPAGQDKYTVTGDLTMHGETKSITLTVEASAPIKDPYGLQRIGFSAEGKIDRREWGLHWNSVLEAGSLMVSHDVRLLIAGEATLSQ